MTHLGLFEGIGGFSLAARWMGWETIAWCEWDEFCQQVLKKNFPEVKGQHGNIKETDFTQYAGRIDILTGGFPCQPFSTAGKRKGKEDDRFLWPEMLRAIREVRPAYVVGENVRGLLNISGGLVFKQVLSDLEDEGYEVLPFLIPACAVNAPHRRDRIWIIAQNSLRIRCNGSKRKEESGERRFRKSRTGGYEWVYESKITSNSRHSNEERGIEEGQQLSTRGETWGEPSPSGESPTVTDPERIGQQGPRRSLKSSNTKENSDWKASWSFNDDRWPIESPLRGRNDGLSKKLVESAIKAYGNAIVPQVAFEIFKAIEVYEHNSI